MTNNNNEIEKRLWATADELRDGASIPDVMSA